MIHTNWALSLFFVRVCAGQAIQWHAVVIEYKANGLGTMIFPTPILHL